MEISDDLAGTNLRNSSRKKSSRSFRRRWTHPHRTRFSLLMCEQEATELEKDLFVWFRRFCYRPGASPKEIVLTYLSRAVSSRASISGTSSIAACDPPMRDSKASLNVNHLTLLTTFRAAFSFTSSDAPMPEQARILQFPGRASSRRSPGDVMATAQEYLSLSIEDRQHADVEGIYRDLDVLFAFCGLLRERVNSNPTDVLAEASRMFAWVLGRSTPRLFR